MRSDATYNKEKGQLVLEDDEVRFVNKDGKNTLTLSLQEILSVKMSFGRIFFTTKNELNKKAKIFVDGYMNVSIKQRYWRTNPVFDEWQKALESRSVKVLRTFWKDRLWWGV